MEKEESNVQINEINFKRINEKQKSMVNNINENNNNIILENKNNKKFKKKMKKGQEKDSKRNIITQYSINVQQKEIEKVKNIMEYTDDEKNELSYELAIEYDKRNYLEYYISLLKTKHNLVNSFFYNNDYNSKIIKIDIFILGFVIDYTANALFFDDDSMHKIYESKGSFSLEYEITKILYSSLITMGLNTILKLLALSNDAIIEFKQMKSAVNIDRKKTALENKLLIKFILYFIVSFVFLSFFWYYISMFGAIYRNTQLHLLKDTLISFGLSLIYPFFIYLLPGLFRIPALSDEKKSRECLYKFSKVLQFF